MKPTMSSVCCLLAGTLIATNGFAEEYDFELDVGFGSANFDGSKTIITNGGTVFDSGTADTDRLSVVGSWYFNGLFDAEGPRARAELTSRASSLSFGYGRTEQTDTRVLINTDPNVSFMDENRRFESESDLFAAGFRYVDRDSGWFGNIGLQTSNEVTELGLVAESIDVTEWRLGFGRYIAENTTVSVGTGRIDSDFGQDATVYEVSLEHLGNLGGGWQFAIDLGFDRTDREFRDLNALNAAVSLYPTRDIEFGIAVSDLDADRGLSRFDTSYEAFASWFVTPNVNVSASYRVDDANFLGAVLFPNVSTSSEADSDSFGISATWRFD